MPDSIVVVGGGVVGLATAMRLAEQGYGVVVLEAEDQLALHQTGHNSGVIHSGLYYKPGSVKAHTCRAGLVAMYQFCTEEGIAHRRCGKLVVATRAEELPRLAMLEARGIANGVALRPLSGAELREYEPEVAGIAGLWVEDAGIVNFSSVAQAMAGRVTRHGGEVRTGHRVRRILRRARQTIVETTAGDVTGSFLINCAGLQSDRVARMAGVDPGIRIVPFRGEYYTIAPTRASLVRGLIYPVPDPALPFLGVHLTRRVNEVVEAGPNAVLALHREGYGWTDISVRDIADWAAFPGFWRMVRSQWRNGIAEIQRSLSRTRFLRSLQALIPALTDADLSPGGSGVRAQAVDREGRLLDDFCIVTSPGAVHLLNAPSPAATASLAIGNDIAKRALEALVAGR